MSSKYHVVSARYHMADISCKERASKQVAEEALTTCDTGFVLLPCVLPKGKDVRQARARDHFVVLDARGQQTKSKIGQYQLVHMNSPSVDHTELALIDPADGAISLSKIAGCSLLPQVNGGGKQSHLEFTGWSKVDLLTQWNSVAIPSLKAFMFKVWHDAIGTECKWDEKEYQGLEDQFDEDCKACKEAFAPLEKMRKEKEDLKQQLGLLDQQISEQERHLKMLKSKALMSYQLAYQATTNKRELPSAIAEFVLCSQK